MTKEKVKDILARAGKTFAQAFISAISVDSLFGITDLDVLKRVAVSMLIAGIAAGISAIWNMAQDFLYKWIDRLMPTSDEITAELERDYDDEDASE